jgi:transposase
MERGMLFWLSDEAWAAIEPHLPYGKPGKPRVDDRRVISGILHVLKVGCRWRDVPAAYGPAKPSTTAIIAGRSTASGSASSRRWRQSVPCRRSFPSTAPTSRRIAQPKAQKGGVDPGDWHVTWRKNEQNPLLGR